MKAEIISIGSEITTGQNLDTNCQWLSQRLAAVGIPVGWHTTVADDLADNVEVFRTATKRARLVIATGGLGPTLDDLTREVVAQVAGVELAFDPVSFAQIEEMFARRKRAMPERNRVQAMVPVGAEAIPNTCGTAPGVWMPIGDSIVVCMPGVPSEMYVMFEQAVLPRLAALGMARGVLVQRKINTFGLGESQIEEHVADFTKRGHVPEVGITASDATISLRIFARAPTLAEALAQAAPIEEAIRARLGQLVYGMDNEDMQDCLVTLLTEKRLTLATAESVTGGLIAQRLSQIPGASGWFRGGIVAYHSDLKVELLGVPRQLIEQHGVVSAEVAEAMAVGARTRLRTDFAVSTTGIAGPDGGTPDKPVGLVYVGLAWPGGSDAVSHSWSGTRTEVQSRAAKLALNRVRLKLLQPAATA